MKKNFLLWAPLSAFALIVFSLASCSKDSQSNLLGSVDDLSITERGGDHGTPVSTDSLPAAIYDYITATYGDSVEVKKAYVTEDGNYIVRLDNHTTLVFDASGNFVEELDGHHGGPGHGGPGNDTTGGPGHGGHHHHGAPLAVDSLPVSITDYVAGNYPDSLDITGAFVAHNGSIIVRLSDGTKLLFDADGNFVKVLGGHPQGPGNGGPTQIDITTLPAGITDYIAGNYTDATIVKAFAAPNGGTVVVLSDGTRVLFDADGNFVKEVSGNGGGHPGGNGGHHPGHG